MGELATELQPHRLVGIDTSIFMYHLEDSPRYIDVTTSVLQHVRTGRCAGITSVLTITEMSVVPLRRRRRDVATSYLLHLLNFPNLDVIDVDQFTALRAGQVRASHGLRTPDALQVAACLEHGATAFVTNDKRLRRLSELQVLVLDDCVDA